MASCKLVPDARPLVSFGGHSCTAGRQGKSTRPNGTRHGDHEARSTPTPHKICTSSLNLGGAKMRRFQSFVATPTQQVNVMFGINSADHLSKPSNKAERIAP